MQRLLAPAFLFALPALALAQAAPQPVPPPDLIVHEWGTFTSVLGSNGKTLLGAHHDEEPLPAFVHGYAPIARSGYAVKGLPVPLHGVTQKMETPVLYFHTKQTQRVRVAVEFQDGLTSQWYPEVSEKIPEKIAKEPPGFHLEDVGRSRVVWDVEVIPDAASVAGSFPKVAPTEPWAFAREVDAAAVRTGKEAEKYLFYRGLGRFTLPRTVNALRGGVVELKNDGPEAIAGAIALEVQADQARFRLVERVPAKGSGAFELGALPLRPLGKVVEELERTVVEKLLLPQGLAADEARAMVRTWARSWFKKAGSRVLYVVPRSEVDRILPLEITPKPKELVRVLLGRIEYLTPEVEQGLAQALKSFAATGGTDHNPLLPYTKTLDRFWEPALRCVLAESTDAAVGTMAKKLLAEYER